MSKADKEICSLFDAKSNLDMNHTVTGAICFLGGDFGKQ